MLIGTDLYYIFNGLALLWLIPFSIFVARFIINYERNNKK